MGDTIALTVPRVEGGINRELLKLDSAIRAHEQHRADGLEDEIRHPDQQMRRKFRPARHALRDENEAVIDKNEHQRDGEIDVGFAAVDADAERNPDERETETGERERDLTVKLHPHDDSTSFFCFRNSPIEVLRASVELFVEGEKLTRCSRSRSSSCNWLKVMSLICVFLADELFPVRSRSKDMLPLM